MRDLHDADLNMSMPGMVMHPSATVKRAETAGRYLANIKPDMAGDWTATVSWAGPEGSGQTSFPVNVKP